VGDGPEYIMAYTIFWDDIYNDNIAREGCTVVSRTNLDSGWTHNDAGQLDIKTEDKSYINLDVIENIILTFASGE
jgi:hypothetical protein